MSTGSTRRTRATPSRSMSHAIRSPGPTFSAALIRRGMVVCPLAVILAMPVIVFLGVRDALLPERYTPKRGGRLLLLAAHRTRGASVEGQRR